jgi:DNA-binding protein HU-beta
MNKGELVQAVAARTGQSQKMVAEILDATLTETSKALSEGEKVLIVGFGSLQPADVAASTKKNPRTGEPVEVPAHKRVKFSAGEALKAAVNGGAG